MIKAIIVEDEAVAARRMKKLLEEQDVTVLGVINSNKELAKTIGLGTDADVFFMDLNLSDGIVFEVLQKSNLKTPIIFTTAYDEYAIKAFKQNSVDYLLKPIDKTDLKVAIDKFRTVYHKSPGLDVSLLAEILNNQKSNFRERFKVKIGDRLRSIKIDDVVLFYSNDKITFLFTDEGRSYPLDFSIDGVMTELDPSKFHRVNRGYIVHIDYISDVISYSNSRLKVVLNNAKDHEIIVARDRVKNFKDWFG